MIKNKIENFLYSKGVLFFYLKTKEQLLEAISANKLFLIKYAKEQWFDFEYIKKMLLVNPYSMEYLPNRYKNDAFLINFAMQSFEIQALRNARKCAVKNSEALVVEKNGASTNWLEVQMSKIIGVGGLDDVWWFDKETGGVNCESFESTKKVIEHILELKNKNMLSLSPNESYLQEEPVIIGGVGCTESSYLDESNIKEEHLFEDYCLIESELERLTVRALQLGWVKKVYPKKWPEHLVNQKSLMLDFSIIDGKTLIHVSECLTDDEELVLSACQSSIQNKLELTPSESGAFLDKEAKRQIKKGGALGAKTSDGVFGFDGITIFSFASERLKSKRDVVKKALWFNSKNIEGVWDYWKDDEQMMLYLLSINRNYVTCISTKLLKNKHFLMSCLNLDVKIFALLCPYILKHAIDHEKDESFYKLNLNSEKTGSHNDELTLRDVKDVILSALDRQAYFLCFIQEPLDIDLDILLAASKNGDPLIGASKRALTLITMSKRRLKIDDNYECLMYLKREQTSKREFNVLEKVVFQTPQSSEFSEMLLAGSRSSGSSHGSSNSGVKRL